MTATRTASGRLVNSPAGPLSSTDRPGSLRTTESAGTGVPGARQLRATLLLLVVAPSISVAQSSAETGVVVGMVESTRSAEPIGGVVVELPILERSTISDASGRFEFVGVTTGTHVIVVRRLGYRPLTSTVTVAEGDTTTVSYVMEPAPIALTPVVVTGAGRERAPGENVRPTTVLSGRQLSEQQDFTIAGTVANQPGVAITSMGPATGQPVIRGLSGDRVLVLEDGQRVGDVSNSGPDHAVAVEGLGAQRVEIVRGPSALRFGSNALGGVINVVREEVPSDRPDRPRGTIALSGQSMNNGVTAAGHTAMAIGEFALRGEATFRTAGELKTPIGTLNNTDLTNIEVGAGAGYVQNWGHTGASYRFLRSQYGIPGGFVGGHTDGVTMDVWRQNTKFELHLRDGFGPFSSVKAIGSGTYFQLDETEAGGILGTRFVKYTATADVLGDHGPLGPFHLGTLGLRFQLEDFDTKGTQSTSPSTKYSVAGFVIQEVHTGPLQFEVGARYDFIRIVPTDPGTFSIGDVRTRNFGAVSGSVGGTFSLTEDVSIGASVARAFRNPDYTELYSLGPHLASYSFEIGNPDLGIESGIGADVFLRIENPRFKVDVAGFYNRIDNFVYPEATGRISRIQLPEFQFVGRDALMIGGEAKMEWNATGPFVLAALGSYVRGTLRDTDAPLPLIPPLNGSVGVRYETPGASVSMEMRGASRQGRTGAFETVTNGYLYPVATLATRWYAAGMLHSLSLRLDNLSDTEYRNHLSRVKSIMPEAGRNMTVVYRFDF